MLRREQVIGIVSSWDIRKYVGKIPVSFLSGGESEGYSVLFTDSRVVGADRPGLPDDFWAYLGPGSNVSGELRAAAQTRADEIISMSNFEMQRDKIVKVLYEEPGQLVGGSMLFVEVGRKMELQISVLSPWNPGIISTLDTLARSVRAFAPDRLYSEKTGQRVDTSRPWRGP
jgi:hypothetical protein